MKKLILSSALILMISIYAVSQTTSTKNNIIFDSSQEFNQSKTVQNNNTKNQVQSKALVPLLPDISFDEFPVNHNMHIATDGSFYYTINGGNFSIGQINKFDLSGNLIQTYPIQIDGRGLSYNKADGFLYASLFAKSIVRIDNLALGTFTTIFTNAMQNDQASFAISNDGTKYYDFYMGTLLVHDFFTGTVINTINGLSYGAGNFGGDAAVAVDSLYIFTWDATIKTVSKYDFTGNLMQTLVLDSGENGHSISRAGNYLFVAHDGNYATGRWYGYLVDSISSLAFANTCFGDSTAFSVYSSNLLGAQWNFGDTASGINNVAYIINPSHLYTQPGTYSVEVIRYYTTYTDTATLSVTINPLPYINLGPDSSFCNGSSYSINAGAGFDSYLWQDGSTDSLYSALTAGTFYVTVGQGGCYSTDSIYLSLIPCAFPVANFASSDTSFCEKQCIDFFDVSTNNPVSWQWFFPGADSTTSTLQNPSNICYNSYGSFDVTLIACNTVGCDTIVLYNFITEYQASSPTVTQSPTGDTLFASPGVFYQWYEVSTGLLPGATGNFYVATTAGNYFVIETDSNGCEGTSNVIAITTGLNNLYEAGEINVAPNPFNNSITISFSNQNTKQTSVSIKNVLGQTVFTKALTPNSQPLKLDLSFLENGIYFLEIISNENRVVKKIVKQ